MDTEFGADPAFVASDQARSGLDPSGFSRGESDESARFRNILLDNLHCSLAMSQEGDEYAEVALDDIITLIDLLEDRARTEKVEFTNELGNRIRITIEGPTSISENVLTPMEATVLTDALVRKGASFSAINALITTNNEQCVGEALPLMRAAFRNCTAGPCNCTAGPRGSIMQFRFPSIEAMHRADDEWRDTFAPQADTRPKGRDAKQGSGLPSGGGGEAMRQTTEKGS